ncbi:MAG: type II toxin-antitoxin system PemK/MazF family toxin [Mogibacterium sp.]|nr:type II toxin-antitoxin system PemK/MazF family toxin [Mogibacterium sp.]
MSKVINKWQKPFHIERGDVYMGPINLDSDLQKGIQRGYRPLLVTQSDWQNRRSESVIVVPGTSELKKTGMSTHIVLPMIKGLPKQTMFCCEQRGVVNVNQLDKYCCTLPQDIMKKITRACRLAERGAKIKCRKTGK